MDSVRPSAVTPWRSRLARVFTKVMHVRGVGDVSLEKNGVQKAKTEDVLKENDGLSNGREDDLVDRHAQEVFLEKVFACISSVKAAYAHLQVSQDPYDGEGIRSADQVIVSEMKSLSELKQRYLTNNLKEKSLDTALLLSEIRVCKSLVKTFEITRKKLYSALRLKDSEITFLKEKLEEANGENELLQRRLNLSEHVSIPNEVQISDLRPSYFISYFQQTVNSIRAFVCLLITEMESVDWDLEAAASSIVPGTPFWKSNHICFAFESFVSRHMFDGFNRGDFSAQNGSLPDGTNLHRLSFDRFVEMRFVRASDHLAWKPKSAFTQFCCKKYSKLVHPKLESSIFSNLDQRKLVNSGETPETPFFFAFAEMAKHVWLLHCLALSFDPMVEIFEVRKGARFSEVYMESLSDEAFAAPDVSPSNSPQVAFVVVPGFKICSIVVQCQVYLR